MSLQQQPYPAPRVEWASTEIPKRQGRSSLTFILTLGTALASSGTSSADLPGILLDPATVFESGTAMGVRLSPSSQPKPASVTTDQAVSELRRLSGLTWEQLGKLFGVARRSIHYWASGGALNARNEKRLLQVLDLVRTADRGESQLNRAALLEAHEGVSAFELLVQERFDEARAILGTGKGRCRPRLGQLSPEAKAALLPRPPEELVEALHDRVHVDRGIGRPARTLRNRLSGRE